MKPVRKTPILAFVSICISVCLASCGGDFAQRSSSSRSYGDNSSAKSAPMHPSAAHASSADAPSAEMVGSRPQERPGLGTQFGEERYSNVSTKPFERDSNRPFAQISLHYNTLEGIANQSASRGIVLGELRKQSSHGGLSISVVDERGTLLHGGSAQGRTYVVGRDAQRYALHIRNDTGGSYEVVASVDGLDVVDGHSASLSKRGYIINPYSTLVIDGFRTSRSSVAAFRFGAVSSSYAAKTSGDRNVGVIGFAFFAPKDSQWTHDEIRRRESANPFPGGFAAPPSIIR